MAGGGLLDLILGMNQGGSPWLPQSSGFPAQAGPTAEELAAASLPAMFGSQPRMGGLAPLLARAAAGKAAANPFDVGAKPFNTFAPSAPSPTAGTGADDEEGGTVQPSGETVPLPRARPQEADATDLSSVTRSGAAGPPMPTVPPQPAAKMMAPVGPPVGIGDGFLERLHQNAPLLMALAGGFAGAPSIGTGMRRAFSGAAPVMAQLQAQQQAQQTTSSNLQTTYKTLTDAGVPPSEALAAIRSPAIMSKVAEKYFGQDKAKLDKIKRPDGTEVPVWVDNEKKTITQAEVPGGGGEDAAAGAMTDSQKSRVQAIIEGREPYPANSRASDAAFIRDKVHEADPQFDAVNYNARLKARQSFASGKDRENLKSFNTTIGHLGELSDAVEGLHNTSVPAWNKYVANPIAEQLSPKYQSALKRFQAARTAVSDELTRSFRGSGGNVHDIIQWENAINSADSPEALRSAIRTAAKLLDSRISAVGDSYNQGMGTTKDPLELLNPTAAASFKHLMEGGHGSVAKPPAKASGKVTIGGASLPWSVVD